MFFLKALDQTDGRRRPSFWCLVRVSKGGGLQTEITLVRPQSRRKDDIDIGKASSNYKGRRGFLVLIYGVGAQKRR